MLSYVFQIYKCPEAQPGIEDDIGKIFQKFWIFSEKYARSLNDPLGTPQQFPILRGGQKTGFPLPPDVWRLTKFESCLWPNFQ